MSAARSLLASALLVLMVAAISCDSAIDVIDEIGTIRLRVLDPGLTVQKVKQPETTIQVAEWQIHNATFTYLGEENPIDLLAGDDCRIVDFPRLAAAQLGNCSGGLVIGTEEHPRSFIGLLEIDFTMQVRRAWADGATVADDPGGDFDLDGELNADDICPLVHRDQATHGNPIPCIIGHPVFGSAFVDSDGDGRTDPEDNCIWVPNNDIADPQLNLEGLGPGDTIGDACEEQTAEVSDIGHFSKLVAVPVAQDSATTITVDFNNARTLDCDWEDGRCDLDVAEIRVCASLDPFANFLGCSSSVQVLTP